MKFFIITAKKLIREKEKETASLDPKTKYNKYNVVYEF
jgi:hypothetical protein